MRPSICCPDPRPECDTGSRKLWNQMSIMSQLVSKCCLGCVTLCSSRVWEAMHTSRSALRPGTAAVVNISAGIACVFVDPRGSVVTEESASLKPLTRDRTQSYSTRQQKISISKFHSDPAKTISSQSRTSWHGGKKYFRRDFALRGRGRWRISSRFRSSRPGCGSIFPWRSRPWRYEF